MDAVTGHLRAKRFHRAENPRPMTITARDLTLLAHVARHRFLTSSQLIALDGGSPQGVLRCLRALYDHGLLDRPTSQLATLHDSGPKHFVYGLAQRGARLLHEYGHHVKTNVDWSEKNRRSGAIFLAHTVAVADFLVQVEIACRGKATTLIREEEIIRAAPEETRTARESLRWEAVSIVQGRRERWSVVPDGVFGLDFGDNTQAYFLIEIDRGTIPVSRGAGDHRSIRRKLKTYYDGWRAQRHIEQFAIKQMRVLTVTSSPKRVQNMVQAVRDITEGKGSNFFLFADQTNLERSNPLKLLWTTGKGETTTLLD
jgi:hypothetical protein